MRFSQLKGVVLASALLVFLAFVFLFRSAYDQEQLRAKRYNSGAIVCRANLRIIESAKAAWAVQHKKADLNLPTEARDFLDEL